MLSGGQIRKSLRLPFVLVVSRALYGCESHSRKELLYDGDSGSWTIDSDNGRGINEYRLFHRDGTLEEYQLTPDDSLHAVEYVDIVPCLT